MSAILIASDHAGTELKSALQKLLSHLQWEDLGPKAASPSVDYPDYAELLSTRVAHESRLGILICGSGIGMSIAANKIPGIRAAVVENPIAAKLAREHNDANILCLGARFLAPHYAAEIVRAWIEAQASTDPRHQGRVKKLQILDSKMSS